MKIKIVPRPENGKTVYDLYDGERLWLCGASINGVFDSIRDALAAEK